METLHYELLRHCWFEKKCRLVIVQQIIYLFFCKEFNDENLNNINMINASVYFCINISNVILEKRLT